MSEAVLSEAYRGLFCLSARAEERRTREDSTNCRRGDMLFSDTHWLSDSWSLRGGEQQGGPEEETHRREEEDPNVTRGMCAVHSVPCSLDECWNLVSVENMYSMAEL